MITRTANVVPLPTGTPLPPLCLDAASGQKTLHTRVLRTLRNAILSGAFEPGEMLTIRPLATLLGVSAMPVREAISRLVADGVLEPLRNRAFRLPVLDLQTFRHLSMARIRLESLLCEHAAVRASTAELGALQALHDRLAAPKGVEPHVYLALHREFHFTIYAAAAMPAVTAMAEMLWLRLGPLMHVSNVGRPAVIDQGFHARLLRALELGDPAIAVRTLQEDIEASCHLIVRYLAGREAGQAVPLRRRRAAC